jgi:tripartite-type tricarboxylate transporter receptor subunit TctC
MATTTTAAAAPAVKAAAATMAAMAGRTFLTSVRAVLASLAIASASAALAQARFPEKPIRFVVNFPAGGPLDILARSVGEMLQASLGQPVVIENKPGAGGNIGAALVAEGAPDGHTVLITIDSPLTINPGVYKSLPFRIEALSPVMVLASSGLMIGTHPGVGAARLQDLIDKGRSAPITFSNAGNGSPGHMAASILASGTGIKANHILYRGNAPAVLAIAAGEVQAGILATPGLLPQVKEGRIVPLAVTSPRRSPLAPDVPTVEEAGLPDLAFEVFYAAMVPAATPQPVVARLAKAIGEALEQAEVKARLAGLDMDVLAETGPAAAARLAKLRQRYGETIRATGMQVE